MTDQIVEKAKNLGADNVAFIKTSDIIFSAELRDTCKQNTCRSYGTNWMCPPGIGGIEECIQRVQAFENGMLIQLFVHMKNSFDLKAMMAGGQQLKNILSGLKTYMNEEYKDKFLVLGAGGCSSCGTCAYLSQEPCRHPEEAFSSVEAHGIYVSDIMKKAGLAYQDGPNSIAYVGMVLY